MSAETVSQVVQRLAAAGLPAAPLTAARFAGVLGAVLRSGAADPYWTTYTFELPAGLFARGELRLNAAGDGALLILEPRDPQGLAASQVDRAALGQRLGLRPNPNIPPEGVDTEYYQHGRARVAAQWAHRSHRLVSLVLKWSPAAAAP